MAESKIYIKEHLLKNIPPTLASRTLRLLFADSGSMPTPKGKKKKCFILVYVSGIAFLRPGLSHWKLTLFISAYEISGIRGLDSKTTREIAVKGRAIVFSCPHADTAVSFLVSAREALWMGCLRPQPFKLTNMPDSFNATRGADLVEKENLSVVRYISMCTRYLVNVNAQLIDFLKAMEKIPTKTIVIGEDCDACEHVKCLVMPIVRSEKFNEVHFRSTMPYAVCRLAHFLLKSGQICDVTFEGYQIMIPSQLRMDTLKISRLNPISLTFQNCSMKEPIFMKLMDELGKFDGEYRKLVFHGLQPSVGALKHLLNTIKHGRCFRGLQILVFDGFHCRSILPERIHKNIRELMKRLHFLTRISLSNWLHPLSFQPSIFQYTDLLTELVLRKQDVRFVFNNLYLPPRIRMLDFSGSHFTFSSLRNLFEGLADRKSKLSLILQDLAIPETHWRSFFDLLPTFPIVSCLSELDWSGNSLLPQHFSTFAGYFFNTRTIRFLGLGRVFSSLTVFALAKFVKLIPPGVLYGLSLEGSVHANFSGHFSQLTQALDPLDSISLLYLDGQRMTDSDATPLLAYVARHSLQELSCDCTALSKETFFEFYRRLASADVPAIGRPYSDVARLFGSSPTHPSFATFRAQILPHLPATPLPARCAFSSSDAKSLHAFARTFVCERPPDPCGLVTPSLGGPARVISQTGSLAALNRTENPDPLAPPSYPPDARDEKEPERAVENAEPLVYEEAPDIYVEPLWHGSEFPAAMRLVSGAGDVEEEELFESPVAARKPVRTVPAAYRSSLTLHPSGGGESEWAGRRHGGSIRRALADPAVAAANEPGSMLVPPEPGGAPPDITTARSTPDLLSVGPPSPLAAPVVSFNPAATPVVVVPKASSELTSSAPISVKLPIRASMRPAPAPALTVPVVSIPMPAFPVFTPPSSPRRFAYANAAPTSAPTVVGAGVPRARAQSDTSSLEPLPGFIRPSASMAPPRPPSPFSSPSVMPPAAETPVSVRAKPTLSVSPSALMQTLSSPLSTPPAAEYAKSETSQSSPTFDAPTLFQALPAAVQTVPTRGLPAGLARGQSRPARPQSTSSIAPPVLSFGEWRSPPFDAPASLNTNPGKCADLSREAAEWTEAFRIGPVIPAPVAKPTDVTAPSDSSATAPVFRPPATGPPTEPAAAMLKVAELAPSFRSSVRADEPPVATAAPDIAAPPAEPVVGATVELSAVTATASAIAVATPVVIAPPGPSAAPPTVALPPTAAVPAPFFQPSAIAASQEPPAGAPVVKPPPVTASPTPPISDLLLTTLVGTAPPWATMADPVMIPTVITPPPSPAASPSAVTAPVDTAPPGRPVVPAAVKTPAVTALPTQPVAPPAVTAPLVIAPSEPPQAAPVPKLPPVPATAVPTVTPPAVTAPTVTSPPQPSLAGSALEVPTVTRSPAPAVVAPEARSSAVTAPPEPSLAAPAVVSVPSLQPPLRGSEAQVNTASAKPAAAPTMIIPAPVPTSRANQPSPPGPVSAPSPRAAGAVAALPVSSAPATALSPTTRSAALAAIPLSLLTAVTNAPSAGPPPRKVVAARRPLSIAEVARPAPKQSPSPLSKPPGPALSGPPGDQLPVAALPRRPSLTPPPGLSAPPSLSRPPGGFRPLGRPGFGSTLTPPTMPPPK